MHLWKHSQNTANYSTSTSEVHPVQTTKKVHWPNKKTHLWQEWMDVIGVINKAFLSQTGATFGV